MQAYSALEKIFETVLTLNRINAVLEWDSAVMMPKNGHDQRAIQLGLVESLTHSFVSAAEVTDLIASAKNERLHKWQKRNLDLMERAHLHASCIDSDLARAFKKASYDCENVWRNNRNDFKKFSEKFTPVLGLAKEIANAKAEKFKCTPYETTIDLFDPGRKISQLDEIFGDLKIFLPDFIKQIISKQKKSAQKKTKEIYDIVKQKELAIFCAQQLGFDFNSGRIDISAHPFSTGYPGDQRITTRFSEDKFLNSLMAVCHETGHSLYEKHLPHKWSEFLLGQNCGMTIHESQSLTYEMQIASSLEFFEFIAPKVNEIFNAKFTAVKLYAEANRVQPSLIRVEADEVTYPLHVILRYEIEKDLFANQLTIQDLPDVWNEKMKNYLGIAPKDFQTGCMQDIHWPSGSFGYFPSYSLGAIAAAQIFASLKKAVPEAKSQIRSGNFNEINNWLKEKIHSIGASLNAERVIENATGAKLNATEYKNYLTEKYLSRS